MQSNFFMQVINQNVLCIVILHSFLVISKVVLSLGSVQFNKQRNNQFSDWTQEEKSSSTYLLSNLTALWQMQKGIMLADITDALSSNDVLSCF